ncbi:MAG: membrane protein insertase YidC [Halieaceae bacterium]|jgi:YidC/Oxa1 family membrane protein insertase|nr:membrane protein insertase YidC [Halieaceae bacterium]
MDIPRYALIAASAVLTLMLLVEWTAFKEARQPAQSRDRIAQTSSAVGEVETDLPPNTVEAPAQVADDDLPTVVTTEATATPEPSATEGRYIAVTTDTLELAIDLQGGDIVEAALRQFPDAIDTPDNPYVLLEQNATRTYVAQSGLLGSGEFGIDKPDRAQYVTERTAYEMQNEPLTVTLAWAGNQSRGLEVYKHFSFRPGNYLVDVRFEVRNNTGDRWQGVPFAQLKRDNTPPPDADQSGFGLQPFLGAALTQPDERFSKYAFDDIADEPFRKPIPGGWIAIIQHYFLSAWVPPADETHQYRMRQTSNGFNIAGFTSPAMVVDAGRSADYTVQLYVGPKDQYRLAEISDHLDLTVDYGWLWWIAQPLFWLLTKIQSVVGNWGVAIILLTVLVKGAFFKLSAASYRSMAKMRKVQPKMQAIREEYANDKQKQSQAMMELYRKEKINPMGGCLPILIQMPVFISLYWVLMESVELRQAPFALWIEDLSVMDPYFVLPILMGASMFFMQKLNPPPPDPMQAKLMQWLPVVFTFFFLWFPAGLVLYWVVNNLLSMTQQYVITRRIEADGKHA